MTHQPWYEAWFDRDEYEIVYRNRDNRDAARLLTLIENVAQPWPGAAVLDMACGRGRHAIALAQRGYQVTGVDLSERALNIARHRGAEAGVHVTFRHADMRLQPCDTCFDGVVNLFTSFGYFEEETDHERALHSMAHALKPGGWLVQDFLNAPYAIAHLVPEDVRHEGDLKIVQTRTVKAGRLEKRITLHRGADIHTFSESVRLLTLADFEHMYARVGLELRQVFGDYEGHPHTAETPRLILYAHRKS